MARKEKLNVDYFPHKISRGKKMRSVVKRYGNDGRSTWWTLLEELALADHHFLDLREEMDFTLIADECNVNEQLLEEIIQHLVKFKIFDEELWKYRVLRSNDLIDSVEDVWSRRNMCIMTDQEVLDSLDIQVFKQVEISDPPTLFEVEPSIPSNNDQKEIKPRKKKPVEDIELVYPYDSEEFKQHWELFKDFRKQEHRFTYKSKKTEQVALMGIVDEGGVTEEIAIKMILQAIRCNWRGIYKLKNGAESNTNSNQTGRDNSAGAKTVSNDYLSRIANDLAGHDDISDS